MELDLTGLHIEITDSIREFVMKKIARLNKYFDETAICHVTFSVNKEMKDVDIRIEYRGKTYMAEDKNVDLYDAVDNCVEKIDGQARKNKTILENRRRANVSHETEENEEDN